MIRAVLLDRDGVLNVDYHYVCSPEQFDWIDGAPEAIRWLNDHDILALVVTNQSGIARGKFSQEDFGRFMEWMQTQLAEYGARLDGIYVCPHHPTDGVGDYLVDCTCRKPKPGLVLQALAEHHLQPGEAILVGDKPRDIEAAEAAGVEGLLFEGGNLLSFLQSRIKDTEVARQGVK